MEISLRVAADLERFQALRFDHEPSAHELADHYDVLAPQTEAATEASMENSSNDFGYLLTLLERERPVRVIEGGCGAGMPLGFLAPRFPKATFLGYDISGVSLDFADARMRRLSCRNVALRMFGHERIGDNTHDGEADLIYLMSAYPRIHHLAKFAAATRSGGMVVILRAFSEDDHSEFTHEALRHGLIEELWGRCSVPVSPEARFVGTGLASVHPVLQALLQAAASTMSPMTGAIAFRKH